MNLIPEMQQTILIADDDTDVITALSLLLKPAGYQLETAASPAEVLNAVKKTSFSLILMDLNYHDDTTSGKEGLELITQLMQLDEHLSIIVMTGWGTVDIAVTAMKLGARDFIQKPWNNERLLSLIQKQIHISTTEQQGRRLQEENLLLRNQLIPHEAKNGLIAQSEAMKKLMAAIERVASSDMNILFTGENGCGKTLLADYLHRCSRRKEQPFICVNMGAITENLFESEMFGHVKGAFTDARKTRIGRFELADDGTLFLDEIANIPLTQQAKLLRVLEEKRFEKLGSSQTQTSNARIISATNANLTEMVEKGLFREDLLYRLNTMEITIPPLRERKEDIKPLAEYFISTYAAKYQKPEVSLAPEVLEFFKQYTWPGNIRELSHVLEQAFFLCSGQQINTDSIGLMANKAKLTSQPNPDDNAKQLTLLELEHQWLNQRLQYYQGNVMAAAKSLGISRSAFYRRLDKHKA